MRLPFLLKGFKMPEINYIGTVHTDFPDKFGVPRQSNVVKSLTGKISFNPPYNQPEAFHGLEGFDRVWILFRFHRAERDNFCATVKPPRLGGNTPVGVFATRSPFRPNSIGMTCAKIDKIEYGENGAVLYVSGIDLVDGTPVVDIKPYLPYADSYPDAKSGFTANLEEREMEVVIPDNLMAKVTEDKRECLIETLSRDPRPGYKRDDNSEYGMFFLDLNIRFRYQDDIITVTDISKA